MTDSAFNDRPELPESGVEIYAAAIAEGCPQDFPPAREARPATRTQTATAKPRRQAKKKPTAQDELDVQTAYFAGLKPADGSGVEAVQPMKFISLGEAAKLKSGDYTIKRLFPAQGVVLVYGQPSAGKSFTVFSSVLHIAAGWPVCGRRVKRRPVYYLILEGSGGLGGRVQAFKAWARATGKPELQDDYADFHTEGFALNDGSQCASLVKTILDAGHQGAVVVIDTLSQATLGLDENSSDMAMAIGNATRIAEAIKGLVVLIHHVGKDVARGPRGHSSLMGNVDCAILVKKAQVGKGAVWSVTKSKDDADGQTVGFKLHVIELGLDEDGDPVTSCAAEPCQPEEQMKPQASAVAEVLKPNSAADKCFKTFLAALHETKAEGVHVNEWRPFYYKASTADPHSKSSKFCRERGQLVALGVLSVTDDVYSLTPEFRRRLQADTAAGIAATQHS